MLFNALIKPILEYCCTVWGNCSVENLQRLLQVQQEAISQKEIVFRFRKDIQSLRKAEILIFCAWEVPGCGEICANALLCAHWSAQLSEPTLFEMYLLVILPFVSLPCLREVLPYIGHIGMSSLKGYEKCVDFGHFRLKLGIPFFSLVLN